MLKKRDVSRFAWSSSPADTKAKTAMKATGSDAIETLLRDCIDEGVGPFASDIVCSNIARSYIERIGPVYGLEDINAAGKRKIANLVSSICPPLPADKYSIPGSKTSALPSRVRCKAIRRYSFWANQSPHEIAIEYAKARVMGDMDVGREEAAEVVRKQLG